MSEPEKAVGLNPLVRPPTARQQRLELRKAGYLPGETAGSDCSECGKNCGRGWWLRVSYEYDEWECWCRECAYARLHQYDDFDFDEMMRISESV